MLYVTQNFYRPSVSIKTTYKIKLLWVLKNWKFLLALSQFQYLTLVHDFNIIRTMLLTSTTWTVNPYLVNVLFNNIEHFVFKKHLKSPKTFWKINFDKSLKFNILKNVINDNQNNVKHILPTSNFIYNQYYWILNVSNISLHKKLYRTLFITYLFFTVSYWPKLNNHFNLILKYFLGI